MRTSVWVAGIIAAVGGSVIVLSWPDQSSVMRYDEAWLLPASGKSGDVVKFYLKGYWHQIPLSCVLAEASQGSDHQTLRSINNYDVDLSKAKVGYLDKLRDDAPRKFTIPNLPPGGFIVTSTLRCQRITWWGHRYETVQPGPTYGGQILP